MPIKVADNLPAKEILTKEHIFVMDESHAYSQDIRPLKIAILNIMPTKQITEVQLLRLISNTPLQVDVTFIHMQSHLSKNTTTEYLNTYYKTFNEIKSEKFDGMIITGAPVEQMDFEEVSYWEEIKECMEWTKTNVTSTFHICWGAQAGLYYHYGIPKYPVDSKVFGVFPHKLTDYAIKTNEKLLMGFDDIFYVPHSRHTEIKASDIEKNPDLKLLSYSETSGVYMVIANNGHHIFVTGHSEYDRHTLDSEYKRDIGKGMDIKIPVNYYKNDNPDNMPINIWSGHANILFSNWLNYYVYQETPFEL